MFPAVYSECETDSLPKCSHCMFRTGREVLVCFRCNFMQFVGLKIEIKFVANPVNRALNNPSRKDITNCLGQSECCTADRPYLGAKRAPIFREGLKSPLVKKRRPRKRKVRCHCFFFFFFFCQCQGAFLSRFHFGILRKGCRSRQALFVTFDSRGVGGPDWRGGGGGGRRGLSPPFTDQWCLLSITDCSTAVQDQYHITLHPWGNFFSFNLLNPPWHIRLPVVGTGLRVASYQSPPTPTYRQHATLRCTFCLSLVEITVTVGFFFACECLLSSHHNRIILYSFWSKLRRRHVLFAVNQGHPTVRTWSRHRQILFKCDRLLSTQSPNIKSVDWIRGFPVSGR